LWSSRRAGIGSGLCVGLPNSLHAFWWFE